MPAPDPAPRRRKKRPRAVAMKRLYVIRLDPKVLEIKRFRDANPDHRADKPCVYLGSTGLTPEERFAQHKRGFKAARFAKLFGIELHRKTHNLLAVPWPEAEARERALAAKLRKSGYAVWQN